MKVWMQEDSETNKFLQKRFAEKGAVFSSFKDCDLAVLQFPYSNINDEMKSQIHDGQRIVCGKLEKDSTDIAKQKNLTLYQPLLDEEYLLENAKLTAEGAVFSAMSKLTIALKDAVCMVIGYGRIGKELTNLLRSLSAKVIVAARREESRIEAGENSVAINDIEYVIKNTDLILNTVPSTILSESSLFNIKQTSFLFELAGKPYGFDIERARAIGIHAYLESGLPGRYCPESAASALFRFIERSL